MKEYHLTNAEYRLIQWKKLDGKYIIKGEGGGVFYYVNGEEHREDGPAEEYYDGEKRWYINGSLHRLDGPAMEYPDGDVSYWINGENLSTKEEYETAVYLYKNKLENYI